MRLECLRLSVLSKQARTTWHANTVFIGCVSTPKAHLSITHKQPGQIMRLQEIYSHTRYNAHVCSNTPFKYESNFNRSDEEEQYNMTPPEFVLGWMYVAGSIVTLGT